MYRRYEGNSGRSTVVPEPEKVRGQFRGKTLAPMPGPQQRPQQGQTVQQQGQTVQQQGQTVQQQNQQSQQRGQQRPRQGQQRPQNQKPQNQQPRPERGGKRLPYEAPPSPLSGLSGELGKIFGRLGSTQLDTEDLLLLAVLYLMYRESGDRELLIMMGALMFM